MAESAHGGVEDLLDRLERAYRQRRPGTTYDGRVRDEISDLASSGAFDAIDEAWVGRLVTVAEQRRVDGGTSRPVTLLLFRLVEEQDPGVLARARVDALDAFDHALVDVATAAALGRSTLARRTAQALRGGPWQRTVGELLHAARALR